MNYFLLALLVLFVGCSKPTHEIAFEPETLVPELVIVNFKPTTPTQHGFDLVKRHVLSVRSLNIRYVSSLPADSLTYVIHHVF